MFFAVKMLETVFIATGYPRTEVSPSGLEYGSDSAVLA